MKDEILKGPVINIDETTVQVLKEPKRSKCYMWVFKGGRPDNPMILFQYHPTRSGDVARNFVNGYQGIVQTDGYGGYDFIDHIAGIQLYNTPPGLKRCGSYTAYTAKKGLSPGILPNVRRLNELCPAWKTNKCNCRFRP